MSGTASTELSRPAVFRKMKASEELPTAKMVEIGGEHPEARAKLRGLEVRLRLFGLLLLDCCGSPAGCFLGCPGAALAQEEDDDQYG